MAPRTVTRWVTRALCVARWSVVFFGGLGVLIWCFATAKPPFWVNLTMSFLWGHGVARMVIWDSQRLSRKAAQRALAQLEEIIATITKDRES